MPKVSVLIPAYNCENYIVQALDSVFSQTFTNFEVIIVEDCSTDNTYNVILDYIKHHPNCMLFKNQVNSGVATSLNNGLKHCTGEYIARMDADDICEPKRLQAQVDFLEANKCIAAIGTAFKTFGNRATNTNDVYAHKSNSIELALLFISNARFCHPTVMIRSKIINQYGGYPNAKAEDFALFSKISQTHLLSNLKQPLLNYRQHPSNVSKISAQPMLDSAITIFNANVEFYGLQKHASLLYDFFEKYSVRKKNIFAIIFVLLKTLNKIRNNYEIGIWEPSFWYCIVKYIYKPLKYAFF